MALDIIIASGCDNLRPWIEGLPESFPIEGDIVQHKAHRNTIKRVTKYGCEYNIKSFHPLGWFKGIIYTFFRTPKAVRSYRYAEILLQRGVGTPRPIAYLLETNHGLLHRSYYVSLQLSGKYREIRFCYDGPLAGNEEVLAEFAAFTARLHDKEVYHKDYSPGNILWLKNADGTYDFQLVDINRMKFCPVTMEMGCRNFARLFECEEIYRFIAREYARCRGFDPDECERLVLKYKKEFDRKRARKRLFKKILGRS